jgi:guanylate kinase
LNKGILFVISGPSGAGKSSLIKEVLRRHKEKLSFSVSCTSRQIREGEKEGIDYFFITEEDFKDKIEKDVFLEWAYVHGNYYGTSKEYIESIINQGRNCILDIDVQGALILMDKKIEATYIFVSPPSIESLKERLMQRGTDIRETIELRVKNAELELKFKNKYQFIVVNDDFERALKELENIILK